MGLFDRLKKTREHKAKEKAALEEQEKKDAKVASAGSDSTSKDAKKKPAAKKSAKKEAPSDMVRADNGSSALILVTPWVSEKAARHADAGTYAFRVPTSANKVEIRKAVESLWSVNVDSVRTVRGKGKVYDSRTRRGKRANWKKALVTLKKGQSIDLYEGV